MVAPPKSIATLLGRKKIQWVIEHLSSLLPDSMFSSPHTLLNYLQKNVGQIAQ